MLSQKGCVMSRFCPLNFNFYQKMPLYPIIKQHSFSFRVRACRSSKGLSLISNVPSSNIEIRKGFNNAKTPS